MTTSQFWELVAALCFISIPVVLAHLYAPPQHKPLALLRALAVWAKGQVGRVLAPRPPPRPLQPPPLPFAGMPAREPGEPAATSKQRDFIRHLTRIPASELHQLGKWQASWMIDRALQDRQSDPPPPQGCSIGIIMGACLVCWTAWRAIS
jgi:hypothetical protein